MKALGIDIGGSAIKGAPVNIKTGQLLTERYRIEVNKDMSPIAMANVVGQIAKHFKWRGPIGIGFPGAIQGSMICTSANLSPRFVGCDGARLFGRATGCRVAMINDAAAAGVAEMHCGAGRGFMGTTLLLTLGTGVGTCLAYQGVVVPMEMGHLPWKGGKSAEKHVAASVRENRELSWKEWGGRLRDYVRVMEDLLWPELIIIGGGISSKHEKYFKFIKPRAGLVPAQFLNQAGIAGAAMWSVEAK